MSEDMNAERRRFASRASTAAFKVLAKQYFEIFQAYVKEHNEASLSEGYELARQAMVSGYSSLEMAEIHHEALRRAVGGDGPRQDILTHALVLFANCLSPFEMSHRGSQEGTLALLRLNEVMEGEIKGIAHALHDDAGQLLSSVHIAIADLASEVPPEFKPRLAAIVQLLRQTEEELRDLSHALRPTVLDNLGLVPAVETLAERVTRRTGIVVSISSNLRTRLPSAVETTLYRIVQEALNNAGKHAQAKSVKIDLRQKRRVVLCVVRDDGRGIPNPRPDANGLGLVAMRERINALGGSLRLESEPRRGTTLVAQVPVR
jgi:signal transduction histidine kinase